MNESFFNAIPKLGNNNSARQKIFPLSKGSTSDKVYVLLCSRIYLLQRESSSEMYGAIEEKALNFNARREVLSFRFFSGVDVLICSRIHFLQKGSASQDEKAYCAIKKEALCVTARREMCPIKQRK